MNQEKEEDAKNHAKNQGKLEEILRNSEATIIKENKMYKELEI